MDKTCKGILTCFVYLGMQKKVLQPTSCDVVESITYFAVCGGKKTLEAFKTSIKPAQAIKFNMQRKDSKQSWPERYVYLMAIFELCVIDADILFRTMLCSTLLRECGRLCWPRLIAKI